MSPSSGMSLGSRSCNSRSVARTRRSEWNLFCIAKLNTVALVELVKGNVDNDPWASAWPPTTIAQTGSAVIYVLHNLRDLDLDPATAGFHIVVSGHSHDPSRIERDGVLYLNPGSAGPRRFKLPVTIARLDLSSTPWSVRFISLDGRQGDLDMNSRT